MCTPLYERQVFCVIKSCNQSRCGKVRFPSTAPERPRRSSLRVIKEHEVPKRTIVIGASSGGLDVLRSVLAKLPENFAAPIFIVLHSSPNSPGILGEILQRSSHLRVVTPRNGERIEE